MLFDGKAIIVTGGAGGIGRATAQAFAKEGGHAAIADLNGDSAEEAAKEGRSSGRQGDRRHG
jgi:3-hydroxybutyrate dehydrogenase